MINKRSYELSIAVIFLAISAACFIIHFLFFRNSFPAVNIDEASFFSPAINFANKGILSSDIHKSFLPGASDYTYWMPPFYLVLLGSFLKIFGSSVIGAKLLSMLLTCTSALVISAFSKDKFVKACAASLFIICPFIIITSAFIRVEALALLLISLAIVAIRFNLKTYVLGIVGGLALMTHPLMVPCCAALALVVMKRGWKPFLIFSLVVLIVITPYLFYIFQNVDVFKEQMALQFSRKSKAKITDLKLLYILQSVPITLLALFCLYKVKLSKELKLFLASAITLSLLIVLKSNEFNYQVYLVPYVLAAVILVMEERKESIAYRYVLPLALYGFFAVLLVSKIAKTQFRSDKAYNEMITYLNNNKSWSGKNIYVTGGPDISTFLLMNRQNVERQIPIAVSKSSNWIDKYNYVVEVSDNRSADTNNENSDSLQARPWLSWKKSYSFTTANGAHSLQVFQRE